jgi:hypothetical protein
VPALAVLALVVGAAAVVLVASPIHRAYYFDRAKSGAAPSGPGGVWRRFAESGPPIMPGPTASVAAVRAPRSALVPDAEGRLAITLVDARTPRLPAEGVPPGWEMKEFAGRAAVGVVPSEIGAVLRLRSEQSSFAVYRDVIVDPAQLPWLSWMWKVVRLPAGADVRHAATDDQAAQVYVIFPRWPAPLANSDVIGYVWDTTAPAGTRLTSPKAANVRIIVVESGTAGLGVWRRQQRNVLEDYAALFGRRPPRLGSVAVMIDSDDTAGMAEALVGALAFSRTPS